jgi:hypothetical protein
MMKFLTFAMFEAAKGAEIAQAADQVAKTPGQKMLAQYVCQGIPFPGVTPNTMVTISVGEAENNEAIGAVQYPLALAGATVWAVPVLEMPVARAAKAEKKYRGRTR